MRVVALKFASRRFVVVLRYGAAQNIACILCMLMRFKSADKLITFKGNFCAGGNENLLRFYIGIILVICILSPVNNSYLCVIGSLPDSLIFAVISRNCIGESICNAIAVSGSDIIPSDKGITGPIGEGTSIPVP